MKTQLPSVNSEARHAFTLLELLVVIAIVSILLVAIVPAINTISKSTGRKATVSLLLGVIEQARAQAIKDGRATYVVFAAQPVGSTTGVTDQNLSIVIFIIPLPSLRTMSIQQRQRSN